MRRERERTTAERREPDQPPEPAPPAWVLDLQRSAGNAAVTRLLARDTVPDVITGAGENLTVAGLVAKGRFGDAWLMANGLSMEDMLRQMKAAEATFDDLFTHLAEARGINLPRLQWARTVVKDHKIAGAAPDANQLEDAVRFLVAKAPADAEKVFGVALSSIGADAAHKPTAKFRERLKAGEAKARELVARAGGVVPETTTDWGIETLGSG